MTRRMPKLPASISTTLPCPRTSATVLHPRPPWHTVLPGKPWTRISMEKPPTVIVGCCMGAFMIVSYTSVSSRKPPQVAIRDPQAASAAAPWIPLSLRSTGTTAVSTPRLLIRDREEQILPRAGLLLHRTRQVHELDELHHIDRRGRVVHVWIGNHLLHLVERGALLLRHLDVDFGGLARIGLDPSVRFLKRRDHRGADLRIGVVELLRGHQ